MYYTKEEIACGKTPEKIDELLIAIEEYLKHPEIDKKLREERIKRFWEYDSDNTREMIYQQIRRIQEMGRIQ